MEKVEAIKDEMLVASLIWIAIGAMSARYGETKWTAYFLWVGGYLGCAGVFLALAIKRVREKSLDQ